MIKAECHSDDRKIEASFDAEPYLIQATDDQIKSLIACGLGGDYPADRIVEFFAGTLNDVRKMFDYCADKDEGFECHITDTEAFWAWIKKNRPALQNGEQLLDDLLENMSFPEAKEKLYSLMAILILDRDKEAVYMSKSKTLDDDKVERLRQRALNGIPDNLILE
jgi:hypothetical protein